MIQRLRAKRGDQYRESPAGSAHYLPFQIPCRKIEPTRDGFFQSIPGRNSNRFRGGLRFKTSRGLRQARQFDQMTPAYRASGQMRFVTCQMRSTERALKIRAGGVEIETSAGCDRRGAAPQMTPQHSLEFRD